MICPSCGKDNPSGSVFCNGCGSKLPSAPTTPTTIYCPYCGAPGQEYQLNCTKCGKELPRGVMGDASRTQLSSTSTRLCPNCGQPMSIYDVTCPYCRATSTGEYLSDDDVAPRSESQLPVVGGVLILIGGVLGIVYGMLTLGAISAATSLGYSVSGYATCCGLLAALFGLIAVFGGYNGIKRDSFAFALVGGILGIFSVGFFLGALLSLIGLVFVAVAHRDFES